MKSSILAYFSVRINFTHILSMLVFLVLFFFFPRSAFAATNTDTMLGYWKFDSNVSDLSGHGNTGTLNGSPVPSYSTSVPTTSFPNSRSLNFGGMNSYVAVPNDPGVQPTDSLTFSMWVYLNSYPGANTIIGGNYDAAYPQRGFKFIIDDTQTFFYIGNGSTYGNVSFSSTQLPLNSWSHLTGTWNGSTMRIYLNEMEMNSAAFTGPVSYGTTSFLMGNFTGRMDDVRLYNRAFSSLEVADLASGDHTSIMWDGSYSTDYENTENWSLNIVPDPYTLVTIPNVSNDPEFSTTLESMAGLQIDAGASMNFHGYNFTMNDSGVFSNNGDLILENTDIQSISGFINDLNSGTVIIDGSASAAYLKTGSEYYNLTMNGTGAISSQPAALVIHGNFISNSGTFILSGNMTVSGNILLNGGNLDSSTGVYSINLYGNWSRSSGIFLPGSGTVTFNGANQSIAGSNDFYNLSKIASGSSSLTFQASSTQTIVNNLYLQGSVSSPMSLRSTTNGTQWRINPQGPVTISYLDVMDSYNAGITAIMAAGHNIANSGNNAYWIFDTDAPVIILDSISTPTSDATPTITGTAVEYSGVVSLVQFQMETIGGTWISCAVNDGTFNETSEAFSCTPSTALSEGAHVMYIRATDSDGYTTSNVSLTAANFTVDLTEPEISSVVSDPGTDDVTVSWTTDESASSIVDYGETSSYGYSSNEFNTTNRVTSHSVSIASLDSCTNYHFRVRSRDSALNQGVSTDYTFATGGCSDTNDTCDDMEDPGSPDIVDVQSESLTSIKLEIDEASGTVDHYKLEYGTSSGNYQWDVDDISEGDVDSMTIEDLSSGTAYYFRIRAINDCGNGDWSDEESGKTKYPPEPPSTTVETAVETASPEPEIQTTQPIQPAPLVPEKIDFNGTTSLDWQRKYFGSDYCYDSVKCGGQADPDGDGLSNDDEFRLGTDPNSSDTDGDGLKDGTEIENGKNPAKASDQQDGDEIIFESPKESGEVEKEIYEVKDVEMVDVDGSKKLKISGKGLPNSYVTIFIYSDSPTVLTIKTDKDGNWSYLLDKDLEDGEHQVYVAVTDNTGKITAKSEPLAFVKTAQAVTKINNAQASSPVEKSKNNFLKYIIFISAFSIILALVALGWHFKRQKSEEVVTGQ